MGANATLSVKTTTPITDHAIDAALFTPLTVHLSDAVGLGFGPRIHWRGYFSGDESSVVDFHRVRIGAGTWLGASF